MSANILRDTVRDELQQLVDAHAGYLTDNRNDTLDQMRFNQGYVTGLRDALLVLQQRYRDLHG